MRRSRFALGLLLLPGGVVLTAALAEGGHRLLAGSTSPAGDPAAAIAGLAAALASLITTWLTLCLALALAAELPGAAGDAARRVRGRVTPVIVRRWAAVVLGASVTATAVPGTAVAAVPSITEPAPGADSGADPTAPSPGWAPTSASPVPTTLPAPGFTPGTRAASSPGWVPRRPAARQRSDPHLLTGRHRSGGDEPAIVVRRGDTLWSISAAHLGPEATDAEIALAWPRWQTTNASVIGSDPHSLLPGTLLTPPPTD